jgi:uncharacterized membrane protein YeaQ/YmgE (transglycosylase-associated protein family)
MTLSWKEWKLNDIIWGIGVPLIIAFVIIAFPTLVGPALRGVDPSGTLEGILVYGFPEMVLIVAIPMLIGLVWNPWAGGASGFLLGCIHSMSTSLLYSIPPLQNTYLLGYIVSGMLTGYIAGALNKGSYSYKRMMVSGLVAAIVGGLLLFFTYKVPLDVLNGIPQPVDMAADIPLVMFTTLLPRIIFGIIVPLIAKIAGPVWHSS